MKQIILMTILFITSAHAQGVSSGSKQLTERLEKEVFDDSYLFNHSSLTDKVYTEFEFSRIMHTEPSVSHSIKSVEYQYKGTGEKIVCDYFISQEANTDIFKKEELQSSFDEIESRSDYTSYFHGDLKISNNNGEEEVYKSLEVCSFFTKDDKLEEYVSSQFRKNFIQNHKSF